jgi:hypothetical protein
VDATDARTLVRTVARRMGADPDAVLGRDRSVAEVRKAAMLELLTAGCSHRGIARVFGRVPGTIGEVLKPWRIGSSGRRRTRVAKRLGSWWRPDRRHTHAAHVKDFAEHLAHQLGGRDVGNMVQVPIDAASASSTIELVAAATATGRRIVVVSLDLSGDAEATLGLASNATVIGGSYSAARGQYHFFDKFTTTDGHALNLTRSAATALRGTLIYRLV